MSESPPEIPNWRRQLSRINWWWLVPALGAVVYVSLWRQQQAIPTPDDWQRATAAIRGELKPGDGVTWAPYWAGEGRLYFQGLPAFHTPHIEAADLSRYDRVWLLGAFGVSAADLPAGHTLARSERYGNVTLDLVEVGGPKVVADLRAELESAVVTQVRGERTKACNFWDGRGWHCSLKKSPDKTRDCLAKPISVRHSRRRRDPRCGLNRWLHVSRDTRVIGHAPRRCVWMHPKANHRVETRWTIPAADSLVLDYGFADQMISDHSKEGTRVHEAQIEILRDGKPLGQTAVPPVKAWSRLELPLGGAGGEITVVVRSKNHVDAHLCVDLTARKAR